jgi:hypothetical protein
LAARQWVALGAGTDRRSWARSLARAHEKVLSGGRASIDVREVISQSWQRCSRAELDPVHGLAPLAISGEEAEERWHHSPLNVAEPLLRELLDDVGDAGEQVVLVCDADGVMLWIDGDRSVLEQATEIHLERGSRWSEESAGTNAMGTALAAGHSLQVFSAEHFSVPVHDWTCSAAPVRDPETGETVGVLDLSGEIATAHPHSLALVEAAARMIEARLAERAAAAGAALRERHGDRVGSGAGAPVALSAPSGRIVASADPALDGRRLELPPEGGEVGRELGLSLHAERVDGGGFLIWRAERSAATAAGGRLGLKLLGRDRGLALAGGRSVALSRRHSEILCLLALYPEGLSAERLALELYGERGKPVTARAEMSRLRAALPGAIAANPYRLTAELASDLAAVESLVARGRLAEALEQYPGPLLPDSEVPAIAEARRGADDRLREALLAAGSADLLAAWLANPSGRDDVEACRELLGLLDADDPRRPAALSRLRRLRMPAA